MGGPAFYKNHLSESETIESAIQGLYENIVIRKALAICISNEDASQLYESLSVQNYPVQVIFESTMELEKSNYIQPLMQFKELPNQILVLPLSVFHQFTDEIFYEFIMQSNPNVLIGNDVPTYHMDKVIARMHKGHQQGFWDDSTDTFNVLWYMS